MRTAIAAALDKAALTQQLDARPSPRSRPKICRTGCGPSIRRSRSVPFDPASREETAGARRMDRRHATASRAKQGRPLELMLATDERLGATHRSESLLDSGGAAARSASPSNVKYYPHRHPVRAARHGRHPARRKVRSARSTAGTPAIDPDNSSQLTCNNFPPHGYNDPRYCSAGDGRRAGRSR